jgi:glycosyltransferase involved in cell wall biosynthesis
MKMKATVYDFYVVIPCYNDLEGLIQSVNSIQYHEDRFAVLVIDDGSKTPIDLPLIEKSIPPQLNLEIINNSVNSGITHALNTGLKWLRTNAAEHKYVARLDCGDICLPDRFYKQVSYLDEHPDTNLLGTWCMFRDFESGDEYTYKTPVSEKQIRRGMYFRNLFIHPTVMWRASAMRDRLYPEIFPHAEDYGLFYELIYEEKKCGMIPEVLMICRIRKMGLSLFNREEQLKSRMKVIRKFGTNLILRNLGLMKLRILMLMPYSILFRLKKMLG